MAKKMILILLMHVVIGYANHCYAQCGLLYLDVYEPNKCGIFLLDTVLNTKHQFIDDSETYLISANGSDNSLLAIYVTYDITIANPTLNDYRCEQYYGCVIYDDKMFLLDKSFKEYDKIAFKKTSYKKGFDNAGDKLLDVINDREVVWTFVYKDHVLESIEIYPPSDIFNIWYL